MPKKTTQSEDVATRVVDATTPPVKRALTEEQKAKMREGRKLAAERRKASSSPEDPVQAGDQTSGSEDTPAIHLPTKMMIFRSSKLTELSISASKLRR